MTKLHTVEITYTSVVIVQDGEDPAQVAKRCVCDICGDDSDPHIEVIGQITCMDELPLHWSGDAIPYGGDDTVFVRDIITAVKPKNIRIREVVTKNKCQCKLCGDIIESKHVHDFVRCKCGEIFTDGGKSYVRRGASDFSNIIDMTESYEEQYESDW